MKTKKARGFFDEEFRHEKIATKDPLVVLSTKVYWEQFRSTLEKAFDGIDYSQGGRPPFDRLMMFKILILQRLYNLSDEQMEYQLVDRLSFKRFTGLEFSHRVPDCNTVWNFK